MKPQGDMNRTLRDAMVSDKTMRSVRARSKTTFERILANGRRVRRRVARQAKAGG